MMKCELCGVRIYASQPHVHFYNKRPINYHISCWLRTPAGTLDTAKDGVPFKGSATS